MHADLHADFDEFVRDHGCPPLPELEFIHRSPYLNLFLYPEEADYERTRREAARTDGGLEQLTHPLAAADPVAQLQQLAGIAHRAAGEHAQEARRELVRSGLGRGCRGGHGGAP